MHPYFLKKSEALFLLDPTDSGFLKHRLCEGFASVPSYLTQKKKKVCMQNVTIH